MCCARVVCMCFFCVYFPIVVVSSHAFDFEISTLLLLLFLLFYSYMVFATLSPLRFDGFIWGHFFWVHTSLVGLALFTYRNVN